MMFSELACVGATYALRGVTLTRLAALGTLSRDAGEGYGEFSSKLLSRTAGEEDQAPTGPRRARPEDGLRAWWVRVAPLQLHATCSIVAASPAKVVRRTSRTSVRSKRRARCIVARLSHMTRSWGRHECE
jgi:hypothetical protein